MDKLDYLHRGFKTYRIQTEDNSCKRERKNIKKLDVKFDKFTVRKYKCTIEDDWVKAIEKGLVYIEKAVAEERQFIRTDGETVPIEKAKKPSKDSVVHLAKHSNMITHVPENEEDPIIPDALYIVEKLSDYAVYENRFLYMLLVQLKEFISMRLTKITKLRMTYICDFEFKKEFSSKVRNVNYSNIFHEERYDNPYPIDTKESADLLKRINDAEQVVVSLLKTNLMTEVAKAPMIKPPVTKTNVLKMNNNFKNALALYDFICTYKKDGYSAEEVENDYVPLKDEIADELAELPMLTSFITYKFGNDLTQKLETNYQIEEERLKKLEEEKFLERIKKAKKKVLESGLGFEEYIVLLEKRNKQLEKSAEELLIAKNEIFKLNNTINDLNRHINDLDIQIDKLENIISEKEEEIARLNQKYIDDMNELVKKHNDEIVNLKIQFEDEKNELIDNHQKEIDGIYADFEEEKVRIKEEAFEEFKEELEAFKLEKENLKNEIKSLNNEKDNLIAEKNVTISNLEEEKTNVISEYETKISNLIKDYKDQISDINEISNSNIDELNSRIDHLNELLVASNASLDALRYQTGASNSRDYTTKEGFHQLEIEFEYFNEFFKQEWQKTKKSIRKRLLWTKEEKKNLKKKTKEESFDNEIN